MSTYWFKGRNGLVFSADEHWAPIYRGNPSNVEIADPTAKPAPTVATEAPEPAQGPAPTAHARGTSRKRKL